MASKAEANKAYGGFTIIEVVLVLAIAGLIFMMVFIALPALQAQQRDTQRRNDAAIIAAAIKQYMKNNHGNPPPDSGWSGPAGYSDSYGDWSVVADSPSLRRYLTDLDPGGVTNIVSVRNLIAAKQSVLYYRIENPTKKYYEYASVVVGAICPDLSTDTLTFRNTGKRSDIIVVRYLERGYWYCLKV